MVRGSSVAGRSCRRRGFDACRLHPVLLVGVAGGEASTYAACIPCFLQELPAAGLRHVPFASRVSGKSCRRLGFDACRLHPMFLAGAAGCEAFDAWCLHPSFLAGAAGSGASKHAACIRCCWQGYPRRGIIACRLLSFPPVAFFLFCLRCWCLLQCGGAYCLSLRVRCGLRSTHCCPPV